MSAASVKIFCVRAGHLHLALDDEFEHSAWGVDLGLAGTSTVAVPLYTLTDRRAFGSSGDVWE